MSFLREVWSWAEEGHKHGIPTCCGIRFGISAARPKPLYWTRTGLRLSHRINVFKYDPRRRFSEQDQQGYVPCEYHLLRWLLTGKRPTIRQDDIFEKWAFEDPKISQD